MFVMPIVGELRGATFNWNVVFWEWKMTVPFIIIFLINNFFLIPYFLIKKKYWQYLLIALCMIVLLFAFYPHLSPDGRRPFREANRVEMGQNMTPNRDSSLKIPPAQGDNKMIPPDDNFRKPPRKPMDLFPPAHRAPLFGNIILAIFIIGFNIAIKLLFKSIRDERLMKDLEQQNLQTRLDYLKWQINPHFFMNTLNNIHALIDIDKDKAGDAVIKLSKLMRYILSEADKPLISLDKEIQFMTNYIELMKLRFTDNVEIEVSFPDEIPSVNIPPLLFISYIENAFKYGVSYKYKSFIRINFENECDNRLKMTVVNSNFSSDNKVNSTYVGMENTSRRLQLIYNDDFDLKITDNSDTYSVTLTIPV